MVGSMSGDTGCDRPSSTHNLTINGNVGNIASIAQDNASQTANGGGGNAIASTQGNGKLTQANGEGLLRSLLGPAFLELGQMAEIQAWFWKVELLEACLEKAAEKLKHFGIEPKQVPGKFLKPMLEGAAMENEPELQELWANLIASTAATGKTHPAFPKILPDLSADDARYLTKLGQSHGRFAKHNPTEANLMNLVRLGLCTAMHMSKGEPPASPLRLATSPSGETRLVVSPSQPLTVELYELNQFGRDFLAAVQGPQVSA